MFETILVIILSNL